jgi:glycosyltransferase involved in cell wall biosynthesis
MTKKVLFHRNYKGFQGGHLKVFDYFGHVKQSPLHRAEIFLTPDSLPNHPWRGEDGVISAYEPESADILFVAGLDWLALQDYPRIEERIPVINLVQHGRHASPEDRRYQFLSRRALRICVSPELGRALKETGQCNGPIHVIPNGIDFDLLPKAVAQEYDVFIGGLKRPELAAELALSLKAKGLSVYCVTSRIERDEFLIRMGSSRSVVLLPMDREGFYLPALEAMALGRPLVCLDGFGNRSFCESYETCLMPRADVASLEEAVTELMRDPSLAQGLREAALIRSRQFDLSRERSVFLSLLSTL